MIKLSIVVPMYNESEGVNLFYNRLDPVRDRFLKECGIKKNELELIFINDGSADDTLEKLKLLAKKSDYVRVLNFSRNFGHQIAITAGVDLSKGEAVIVMDGDLQDPPEVLPGLYQKLMEGYDVVYAKRKKRSGESFFKLFTASMFYRILKKLTHVEIPVDTGDFRIMSRRVVNVLSAMKEKNRFIRGMVSWIGFKQTSFEYEREERYGGVTKYTLWKMLKFAFDGITSFSSSPLKMISILGFVTALLGFSYAIFVLYDKFTGKTVQGWTSMIIVVLILGGVQLISLGVMGEYLARIHDESKNRPLYIIEGIYDSTKKS